MAHKTSEGTVKVFDITTFLWHARCFAVLIRPFVTLSRGLFAVVRWKYPKVTVAIWLIVNLLTSVVPTEFSLALFLLIVGCGVVLGVLHHYTHVFIKLFPDGELENSALQAYLQRSWGDEQRILEEYRRVLYKIDTFLLSINSALEMFYNVVKWENPILSSSCALIIGTWSVLVYFADLKMVVFITNNALLLGSGFYLHNKHNELYKRSKLLAKDQVTNSAATYTAAGETASQPDDEFLHSSKSDQNMENDESDADGSEMVDGEDSLDAADVSSKLTEESGSERTRPTVVKKLLDLRKRHHQANAGLCTGCQASFMSILKKKYFCCNCGNQFCSRCCYLKVPKSFLGVTAPSTKNDTVLVCAVCHRHLLAKNSV